MKGNCNDYWIFINVTIFAIYLKAGEVGLFMRQFVF
jgi:hypothetical protein